MNNKWLQRIVRLGFLLLLTACAGPVEEHPPEIRVPPGENIAGLKIITEDGGHLAWSKKTNQIAFDRLGKDGYFDLWLMNPDGTGQKCLTANHPLLPNKHIGQPAWHPTGRLLVIQAQKAYVPRYADTKCTPGAGALNDLWIITADGRQAWKIHTVRDTVSKDAAGVLHPHFSNDGTRLFWAERIRNNRRPFGEWILRIADFYYHENSGPRLGAIRDYNPGRSFAVAADSDWSPSGNQIMGLVIIHRPDTRRRGSGSIVLIVLPTR